MADKIRMFVCRACGRKWTWSQTYGDPMSINPSLVRTCGNLMCGAPVGYPERDMQTTDEELEY